MMCAGYLTCQSMWYNAYSCMRMHVYNVFVKEHQMRHPSRSVYSGRQSNMLRGGFQ